jgi:hypothetical protein
MAMNQLIKTCVITLALSQVTLSLSSQENKIINHHAGQSILSASPTLLLNTPNGVQLAGGLKFQIFLGKRLSIDADLVLSRDYAHFGPGLIGVPLGLFALASDEETEFEDFSSLLLTIAVMVLSFEHISYHIPVTTDLDIAPFVSLLRYKFSYLHDNPGNPDIVGEQLSFATGIQVNKYYGRFVLSPYGEYNLGYRDLASRFNAGIYLGYYFRGKQ